MIGHRMTATEVLARQAHPPLSVKPLLTRHGGIWFCGVVGQRPTAVGPTPLEAYRNWCSEVLRTHDMLHSIELSKRWREQGLIR